VSLLLRDTGKLNELERNQVEIEELVTALEEFWDDMLSSLASAASECDSCHVASSCSRECTSCERVKMMLLRGHCMAGSTLDWLN